MKWLATNASLRPENLTQNVFNFKHVTIEMNGWYSPWLDIYMSNTRFLGTALYEYYLLWKDFEWKCKLP
jgi:hypothetical protein